VTGTDLDSNPPCSSPPYSIVIPTYRRPARAYRLASNVLRHLNPAPREIKLAVQTDDDETELLRLSTEGLVPELAIVRSAKVGACTARNTGAAACSTDFLVFLDDDCEPLLQDWAQHLLAPLQDLGVCAVTGPVANWSDARLHRRLLLPRPVTVFRPLGMPISSTQWNKSAFADSVWGGNFAVRTTAFDAVGGFDERFDAPSIYEESALSNRLRTLGQIAYAPQAAVAHFADPTGGMRQVSRNATEQEANRVRCKALYLESFADDNWGMSRRAVSKIEAVVRSARIGRSKP
jgi:glucosyl-dolichyl phosphate glucuronosyltransferase